MEGEELVQKFFRAAARRILEMPPQPEFIEITVRDTPETRKALGDVGIEIQPAPLDFRDS